MAKKLSAEEIKALNGLKDDEREGLIALLTDVESANAEIQKLRKSQPTESQKVVESAAWAEMEKAVKDRDGVLESEQIRRALNDWFKRMGISVGVRRRSTRAKA